MMNVLEHFPAIVLNPDNRQRSEDACAIRLMDMGAWAACRAIEANYAGGVLSRDAAVMLLRAHTDRLSREITMIELRIRGMVPS